MIPMKRALAPFLLAGCFASGGPRALGARHLENAHEMAPGVPTGAQPRGEGAFREFAAFGVRAVISVDGSKPDLEAARKHGLRCMHLPIGCDGGPEDRTKELAKAIRGLPGPLHLHCRHGKRRGPAAAAVACVAAGRIDDDEAVRAMKTMGTGEPDLGLWASARRPIRNRPSRGCRCPARTAASRTGTS